MWHIVDLVHESLSESKVSQTLQKFGAVHKQSGLMLEKWHSSSIESPPTVLSAQARILASQQFFGVLLPGGNTGKEQVWPLKSKCK